MTIDERMQRVFREVLDDDNLQLPDEATARDVKGWDSLAHINIMFALESEFGIQFSDEQLSGFRTVGELREHLHQTPGA